MKVVAVFAVLLAVALAAPTEVADASEQPVVLENKDAPVEKPEAVVTPSSESSNVDKVESDETATVDPAQTVADPAKALLSVEEKKPVPVTVAPVDEATPDEVTTAEAGSEKQKDMDESSTICRSSTGATLEQIKAISENPEDEAPRAVKCYVKCIDEQLGVVKDQVVQNVADLAAVPQSTPTVDQTETPVDNCGSLETDDPCDSSYLRYSCYFRTTGKKIRIV